MFENVERGEYNINGQIRYFRSKWEANYALYLDYLKQKKVIQDWKYEVRWFEFPERHGATRYLPDFEVTENDGTVVYHEVKGYMTSRSKTQLRRMKKYYPEVKLVLVDAEAMRALREFKKLLKFY